MQIKVAFYFPDATDPTSAAALKILATLERDCNQLICRRNNDIDYACIDHDDPTDQE